jgi:hypothetical protein
VRALSDYGYGRDEPRRDDLVRDLFALESFDHVFDGHDEERLALTVRCGR